MARPRQRHAAPRVTRTAVGCGIVGIVVAVAGGAGGSAGMSCFVPAAGAKRQATASRLRPQSERGLLPLAADGTDKSRGSGPGDDGEPERYTLAWLLKLLDGYRRSWSGERIGLQDLERDVDFSAASILSTGVFNAYVVAAPPAQAPDCMSYSPDGDCCPSLACYRNLPLGTKVFVTGALLLAIRNSLKLIFNPTLQGTNIWVKSIFIAAMSSQVLYTLMGREG
eukprot:CAMPEP_0203921762 /NCGR_PEP_ID=MMETSP0359-20131031/61874_1 /ASSEMBLY_ACC=CAM_ASM_000338 /TAXON_ID=268821 /ORGANISM="Scrippsiella Hangoei, Strain SHTV-5" /LENGTH=223 /DNA_ID=CAMNT_0050849511 /DNA_START=11 /DNA_END=680 /DNA_ORIENTATION=+